VFRKLSHCGHPPLRLFGALSQSLHKRRRRTGRAGQRESPPHRVFAHLADSPLNIGQKRVIITWVRPDSYREPWGRTVPTHKGGIAHEAEGIATGGGPQPSTALLSPECLAPGRRQRREPRNSDPMRNSTASGRGRKGERVEFPPDSGLRLAVVLVVRPFVLGWGNVPP
jgi:hypothetical protein